MARLNTAATSTHKTPRPQKGLADRASIERPATLSRKDSSARPIKGSTIKSKNGPGLTFDIFPDDEDHQPNDEIGSPSQSNIPGSSTKQQKKRTLKVSRANSLLLPIQQRPRQRPNAKVEQDDYDKENDITGDAMEPYTPERSPVPHRSATTRNTTHTPTINRELDRSLSRRECKDKDEDSCGDNGFDSLDEFVVSDNDEISYVETSDSETEKAPTPPPPPKSARKRLMRGRRPTPDGEVDSTNTPVPQSDLGLEHKAPKTRELPTKSKQDLQELSHDDFDLSTQFKTLELDDDNGPASQLETDLTL